MENLRIRQDNHKMRLVARVAELMINKYDAGAKEHGGYIGDMSIDQLIDHAVEESVDLIVYLLTVKEKLSEPTRAVDPAKLGTQFQPGRSRWFENRPIADVRRQIATLIKDAAEAQVYLDTAGTASEQPQPRDGAIPGGLVKGPGLR